MSIFNQRSKYELVDKYKNVKKMHAALYTKAKKTLLDIEALNSHSDYETNASAEEKSYIRNLITVCQNMIDNSPDIPD